MSYLLNFDTHGNDKQKETCRLWADNTTTDIVYGGSKGSAKSYTGCSLIFSDAFTYDGTYYFVARKKLNDIRKFTIPSIYEVFNHWEIDSRYYTFNGQDSYFNLHNGSRVYLIEAKFLPGDPYYTRFGSMQMTRGWIEEAGEFEESAKNNLGASIGRWKNDEYRLTAKLLQTCNPAKNYLYRDYYQKNKNGNLEPWKAFVQALPTDNKMLAKGYLENLRRSLSANERERLLNGNWEYDDDPATLIPYEKILGIFTNDFVEEGETYITADIARFGKDKTTIGLWKGFRVKVYTHKGLSITQSADKIKQLQRLHAVPNSRTIVDEDGIGGGVVDILGCKGFVNNSRPHPNPEAPQYDRKGNKIPENYDNLKSQCYFRLADRINKDGLFVECGATEKEDAIQELEQVKQKSVDSDGKKGVVPKEDVKEIIGRSPDYSDMLMMREYFELAPKFAWL